MAERIFMKDGFDWRGFDTYLFDIDGTLLNSRGRIHYYAFSAAMREVFRLEGTIDGVPWHGNTDIGILKASLRKLGVDESSFNAKREQALNVMRREVEIGASRVEAELCPAIKTVLGELQSTGKQIGVASGNLEVIGWVKLRAAGIADHFQFGSFSDVNETRLEIFRHGVTLAQLYGKKPDPSVCFVGDTPADIDAAHRLGVPVIAVATGIYGFEELSALNPEMCLTSCEDLYPRN